MKKGTVLITEDIDEGQIYIQWYGDPSSELVIRMADLDESHKKMETWSKRLRELGVKVVYIKEN